MPNLPVPRESFIDQTPPEQERIAPSKALIHMIETVDRLGAVDRERVIRSLCAYFGYRVERSTAP